MSDDLESRMVRSVDASKVLGAVVVVDVIRAFTTAAYAFGAGAAHVYLVAGVSEALTFKARNPGSLAMGEDHGLRPDGFDLPNSPVLASKADLDGRIVVQRTSAGTQGVVAARSADRLWCASLVCASATAAAVGGAGLGAPTFVVTGDFAGRPDRNGDDDRLAAAHIDAVRLGLAPDPAGVAAAVAATGEASRTLAIGVGHVDPDDIAFATDVDRFGFAMEVTRTASGLRLDRIDP